MKKNIICIILILLILASPIQAAAVIEESIANEEIVWDILIEETRDIKVACGIMGFFDRESSFLPDVIPYWYATKLDIRGDFLERIRFADRQTFINEVQKAGGFGIGQWYSEGHLKNFYYYFNENGYEYDDLEAQVKFTIWEMKADKEFWEELYNTKNAYYAGNWVAAQYDGASEMGRGEIASLAEMEYKERNKK